MKQGGNNFYYPVRSHLGMRVGHLSTGTYVTRNVNLIEASKLICPVYYLLYLVAGWPVVRCRDVSRGTSSQFEQPASCGRGIEWHGSGANLAVETEIFMYFYASVILARIHTLPQYKQFYTHSI